MNRLILVFSMSLTPAESMELQRLLAKAKSRAMPAAGISDDDLSDYDSHTGLFTNRATGETVDVWSMTEGMPVDVGAMTDAAKRREEMLMNQEAKRVMKPKAAAAFQAAPCSAYSHARVNVPYVNEQDPETESVKDLSLPPLPPGVPDVSTWGETLIEFGQYKNTSMSYFELAMSSDDRAIRSM